MVFLVWCLASVENVVQIVCLSVSVSAFLSQFTAPLLSLSLFFLCVKLHSFLFSFWFLNFWALKFVILLECPMCLQPFKCEHTETTIYNKFALNTLLCSFTRPFTHLQGIFNDEYVYICVSQRRSNCFRFR